MKILLLILLFPLFAFSTVQVAFLEIRDPQGHLLQLEPDGRFAHLAISYQGRWLHSHPYYGVQVVPIETLQKIGKIALILSLPDQPELSPAVVTPLLGKAFDHDYSWSDEKFYCSELVGKLLSLKPDPMDFSAPIWPPEIKKHHGELGLSPDDILRKLSGLNLR